MVFLVICDNWRFLLVIPMVHSGGCPYPIGLCICHSFNEDLFLIESKVCLVCVSRCGFTVINMKLLFLNVKFYPFLTG